jgi:hypothetical protein
LYYSLSVSDGSDLTKGFTATDAVEPMYNKNKTVIDGKYVSVTSHSSSESDSAVPEHCGIDPARIKVLKSDKFQNTLGYKDEEVFLEEKPFTTTTEQNLEVMLLPNTKEFIKERIKLIGTVKRENSIIVDLEFMQKFFEEKQREKKLAEERMFIKKLYDIAFPCCNELTFGERLFYQNCSSCHNQGDDKVIGPGLANATAKYSEEWLFKWTTRSRDLIRSGDQQALKIYNEYNRTLQQDFDLSRDQVTAIYRYIDDFNGRSR